MNGMARITVLLCLCWMVVQPAQAKEVYRWVDAAGVVHYTETPPPGRQAEQLELRVPQPAPDPDSATAGLKRYQGDQDQRVLDQQAAAEKAGKQRQLDEERRAQCTNARDIVERLQNNPAASFQREDGSYQRYSDEEREQRMSEAREYQGRYCD